jgi:hypothetical protein
MKKAALILFATLFVLGLAPLAIAFLGIALAGILGCDLGPNAASCVVLGADVSGTLTSMMMMHWLGILGLPVAALGALGLGLVYLVAWIARLRR